MTTVRARATFFVRLSLGLVIAAIGGAVVAEDYRVQSGDTLRLRIVGLPELQSETVVASDGSIRFPLVGTIQAADMTTADIDSEISQRLLSVSYTTIGFDDVTRKVDLAGFQPFVEVARYRPIFLDGLVGTPGQAEFQFGLSIRAAIVRSGGVRVAGAIDASDAVIAQNYAETQARAVNVDVLQAKRWRLEALVARDVALPFPDLAQSQINPATFAQLLEVEKAQALAELQNHEIQLLALLDEVDDKDVLLELYDDLVTSGAQVQQENQDAADRMEGLEERGLVRRADIDNALRLLEISRAANLEDRIDQLSVQQSVRNLKREVELLEQEFDRQIATEFTKTLADLVLARTNLESSRLLSGAAMGFVPEVGVAELNITLFRDGEYLSVGSDITLEAFVAPGDIITVAR